MIETTALLNYGVLGLAVIYLVRKEYTTGKQIEKALNNNTLALHKVSYIFEKVRHILRQKEEEEKEKNIKINT